MTRTEVLKWLKDNINFNPEETFSSGIPFRLRKHPEIIQEIEKIINFKSKREAELLYRLINLDEKGVCEFCGKPTQFISYRDGYKKACCKECAAKLTVLKGKQTKEKIYGFSGYNNPEKNKETKIKNHGTASYNNLDKIKATKKEKYGSENYNNSEKYKATCLERYGVENGAQTEAAKRKQAQTNFLRRGTSYPMQAEAVKQKYMENSLLKRGFAWPLADPFFRKKNKAVGKTKNEKEIENFLYNRGFEYQYEYVCNGKCFDFAIFKDGELSILIETDGKYFHGLLSDPDGKNVRGEKDGERFLCVPEGVKYLVADADKTQQLLAQITEVFNIDYEEWIQSVVNNLPKDFPYYNYSNERMLKDWEHLCSYSYNANQHLASSIIRHFHRSIMEAHVKKLPSPLEAWNNKALLEKCVRNRMIYGSKLSSQAILDGFSTARFAPRISIFNPSKARKLIQDYLADCNEIFDPFSGFSGRLLGACSLGKIYRGQDLHPKHVAESNEIIQFLGLQNCSIIQKDILSSSGEYECLFTCPPYGGKEHWNILNDEIEKTCDEWIAECLKRFKCKKYLFVVDETEKYKDNIVGSIINRSHLGENKESIILIETNNS